MISEDIYVITDGTPLSQLIDDLKELNPTGWDKVCLEVEKSIEYGSPECHIAIVGRRRKTETEAAQEKESFLENLKRKRDWLDSDIKRIEEGRHREEKSLAEQVEEEVEEATGKLEE